MKVCAVALQRYPGFNASIDPANDQMIYKDYVHIGMAVDTPRGLLVPVIRDVQDKGIIDLAVEIVDTAQRARSKKIKPEEFEGASFTISNQGGIGGTGFTPVVVWPQAAILGISRAQKRLVEREEEYRDPYDPAAVRLLRSPDRGRGRCGAVFGLYLQESGAGADVAIIAFSQKQYFLPRTCVFVYLRSSGSYKILLQACIKI